MFDDSRKEKKNIFSSINQAKSKQKNTKLNFVIGISFNFFI